ncbi:MAG: helix-hairpin-helix domain-containing protein [Desulfobacteraceae bacterium]|nr:helix-hairpin-helix domain-containing protein [Desulfobacteraceae bacterium]
MVCSVAVMAADTGKVNINTASLEELTALNGIGKTYAERIIEFRKVNGPFQKPEDILKIKGIGDKTLEANKNRIIISQD